MGLCTEIGSLALPQNLKRRARDEKVLHLRAPRFGLFFVAALRKENVLRYFPLSHYTNSLCWVRSVRYFFYLEAEDIVALCNRLLSCAFLMRVQVASFWLINDVINRSERLKTGMEFC